LLILTAVVAAVRAFVANSLEVALLIVLGTAWFVLKLGRYYRQFGSTAIVQRLALGRIF